MTQLGVVVLIWLVASVPASLALGTLIRVAREGLTPRAVRPAPRVVSRIG